jgi:prevent-host-death family protein
VGPDEPTLARYKPMGDLLVVSPARKKVEEVSLRELNKRTSEVIGRVRAGGRAIVTKHGEPVAVLIEMDEAIGLCGTVLLTRREAQRRLFGDDLDAVIRRRRLRRAPRMLSGE